ncbi:MAG: aminoglycoside phosphotransferase family protein [Armatimonadetes bacterium]|nr:aminoglycoside phosphotransferase family protein [Armatimonadota bacterium]
MYAVDRYILKVCVNTTNEPNFERETFLYQALYGQVPIPRPVVADTSKTLLNKFYMIYPKIEAEPAGQRWHLLDDCQRKKFIEDLCRQLRRIDHFPRAKYARQFGLNPNPVWKDETVNGLFRALSTIQEKGILPEVTRKDIAKYIQETASVLEAQHLGLVFWDVQLDNMLINTRNRFTTLIDLEGVSIASIDYRLSIVRIMSERPHLFMSVEMESYAAVDDYQRLLEWYGEFYPELFDFPDLEKRIDLYELGDVLHHLVDWPTTKQLHDRLARILAR